MDEPTGAGERDEAVLVERRRFLHAVSREALGMATTLMGASSAVGAMALRAVTLERPEPSSTAAKPAPTAPPTDVSRAGHGRDAAGTLIVADRSAAVGTSWLACPDAATLVRLLGRHQVRSGPVLGALAAWSMAGTVRATATMEPMARRNALGATASRLRAARPASATLVATLDGAEIAWTDDIDPTELAARLETLGDTRAAAVMDATFAVATEAASLVGSLPSGRVVLHGAMSAAAGGSVGMAGSLAHALRATGDREYLVTASTPTGEGRGVREDLVAMGLRAQDIADGAAARSLADGQVAAVVLMAEWVGPDDTVLAPAGALSLAMLAALEGVPCLVLGTPGTHARVLPRSTAPRPASLERPTPDAPPLMDRVPAELITALLTGGGDR